MRIGVFRQCDFALRDCIENAGGKLARIALFAGCSQSASDGVDRCVIVAKNLIKKFLPPPLTSTEQAPTAKAKTRATATKTTAIVEACTAIPRLPFCSCSRATCRTKSRSLSRIASRQLLFAAKALAKASFDFYFHLLCSPSDEPRAAAAPPFALGSMAGSLSCR